MSARVSWRILEGDALERLRELPDESVQTCITSPPYWGLRDYGVEGQLGLEPTPEEYVANLVAVFREVRRVLRDDGTLWLNLGDSYAQGGSGGASAKSTLKNDGRPVYGARRYEQELNKQSFSRRAPAGYKPKDLVGIPWLVAFALRADGWYLRSDIVWAKVNPMPESVTDRPTRAHEYIFLFSKSPRYFYDADAIREPDGGKPSGNGFVRDYRLTYQNADGTGRGRDEQWEPGGGRNKRSVWTVATQPFPAAHFATFPPALIEPCVLAGSAEGDTVLDPFAGSGTTGVVALRHNRDFVGIEINPEYAEMARERIRNDAPLLNIGAEAA